MIETAELTSRARAGDPDAVRELLTDIWPDAYKIARSVVRDACLAEDAAQEACGVKPGPVVTDGPMESAPAVGREGEAAQAITI